MNNKIKLAVVPFFLALGACSSTSSTTPAGGGGASIDIITVSGNFMSLDGTYRICYDRNDGTSSTQDEVVISGSSFSMSSKDYSVTGCTGASTDSDAEGTISSTETTKAVTDWVDGQRASVAPPVASGGGALPDAAEYTELSVTFSGTPTGNFSGIPTATAITIFYVVDDTAIADGVAPVLYRDSDASAGVVSTADPFTKQVQ